MNNGPNQEWITNKIIENDYDTDVVKSLYNNYLKENDANCNFSTYERYIRRARQVLQEEGDAKAEGSFSEEFVKLSAKKQKVVDKNRVTNKINREGERLYNLLDEKYDSYIDLLQDTDFTKFKIKHHKATKQKYGIIQLADVHFNELITLLDTLNNEYDFEIVSKRLHKFFSESIDFFKFKGVTNVYLCLTGDLMNSDRRISEQMVKITGLTKAALLATYLLSQAIIHLNKHFNVTVSGVVGNESRLPEFMDSHEKLAKENWDYDIFVRLKEIFSNNKEGVSFITLNNQVRDVLKLPNGFNIFLHHGHLLRGKDTIKSLASFMQPYIAQGIKIHMALVSHLHYPSIGDFVSRSGSLCGPNSYSETDLGYISRASQNCYVVNNDLSYNGYKIDLMDIADVKGYDIIDKLKEYHVDIYKKSTNTIISQNLV